jgi:hypothetical protein
MAAAATGKQYGGYWTHPPTEITQGEVPEKRMAAAVAAVKNRTEKEEKFQVLEEPLRFDRREPNPNPVRRDTAKVKRKAQNLDGHRVRTESEPRVGPPPLCHGRAGGCTPFSGTMKPLPLDGIQVAMGPQPAGPPQPLQGPQGVHLACTLCGKAEGRLNCKNGSCHRRVCQDCLQQVAYGWWPFASFIRDSVWHASNGPTSVRLASARSASVLVAHGHPGEPAT